MHQKILNRNDPCACGIGLKYKKCCLDKGSIAPLSPPKPDIDQQIAYIESCAADGNLLEAMQGCKALLDAYPDHPRALYLTARMMFFGGMRETCASVRIKPLIRPCGRRYWRLTMLFTAILALLPNSSRCWKGLSAPAMRRSPHE